MSRALSVAVIPLLMSLFFSTAVARQQQVDYLSLAALMIGEGEYERAAEALAKVDRNKKDLDQKRFYTLSGLLALQQQHFPQAAELFSSAIAKGQQEQKIKIYLAQSWYGAKQFEKTIKVLETLGETAAEPLEDRDYLLLASAWWQLKKPQQAWKVVREAIQRYPQSRVLAKQEFFWLIELGLYQAALQRGHSFLQGDGVTLEDYLGFARALQQSAQYDQAIELLEWAKLHFGQQERLNSLLAACYQRKKMPLAAAAVLRQLPQKNSNVRHDIAEMLRASGHAQQALYYNSSIVDQKKKLRQRLSLLLEAEQYETLVHMENDLHRNDMLKDEQLLYVLAYAWFKLGDFPRSESFLSQLNNPRLFRMATELRSSMQQCEQSVWSCI